MKKQYVWLCVAVAVCLFLCAGAVQFRDVKAAEKEAVPRQAPRVLNASEKAEASRQEKKFRLQIIDEDKAIAAARKSGKPYKRKFKMGNVYRITTCGYTDAIGDYTENTFDGTRWQYQGPTVAGVTEVLLYDGSKWVLKNFGDPGIAYQYSNSSSSITPPLTGWVKNATYGGTDPVPTLSLVGANNGAAFFDFFYK